MEIKQKIVFVVGKMLHKNVVVMVNWCSTEERLQVVVEMCSGGDVRKRIENRGKLKEEQAAHVIRQVAAGLQYMHQQKFSKLNDCAFNELSFIPRHSSFLRSQIK